MHPAAALLGRAVHDATGLFLGWVLDVGTGDQGGPKFLLVGLGPGAGVERYEMRDVRAVQEALVVSGRAAAASLPRAR